MFIERKENYKFRIFNNFFLKSWKFTWELLILPLCARNSTFASNVVAKQKLVQLIILPQWGVVLWGLANTITNKDNHSKRSRNSKPTSNKRGLCHLPCFENFLCHKVFLNPRNNFLLKPKDNIQNDLSSMWDQKLKIVKIYNICIREAHAWVPITISFRIRSQISSFLVYTLQNTNIWKTLKREEDGKDWVA